MRIAQVAPLYESVPPKLYGGTERVVSYLTEELVARGHEVTLYASGDSVTQARLIAGAPQALRLDAQCRDALSYHVVMFERILRDRDRYDLIHFHTDYLHYSLARHFALPQVTTLHGRLDLPELGMMYREFSEMPVVSISDAQRTPLPQAHWLGTVHHGLPADLYEFRDKPEGYLAFLGRVSPEKGLEQAIEIATRLSMRLRVAAKVDRADREYYVHKIAPLLHNPYVEFIGEISEAEKNDFLGGARALLFPIDWPEPFGLVLIEAMSCGTPVVAYGRGSVKEIIKDGENGFVVDHADQAVAAVKRLSEIPRARCRRAFDERFTARRMADDYLEIYSSLVTHDAGADEPAQEGRSLWTKPSAYKTSSTSSQPRPGLTSEPAY
jgi:glycosyltransferase involved in cell wall biosynthesis